MLLGFIIRAVMGLLLIGLGIFVSLSKEEAPFGFWANTDVFPVGDMKGYNRTVGKLWCVYGVALVLLGTPLLGEQNSALILLSVVGMMAEVITAMVIHVTIIEKKYRRK